MKEKNKSILKKLGVGALACFGVFAFAGCSSAEISQEQIDTIMETVEQSNTYMQDQIELLKQQNQELQNQNKLMEEANNKLTKEGAIDVLKLAITKLMYNQDNVLDNLKISDRDGINLYYYKTTTGVRCCLEEDLFGDGDYYTLIYDDIATVDDRDVVTCDWVDDYKYFTKTSKIHYDEDNAFGSALLDTSIYYLFSNLLDLEQKDIIGYEMVDGNYVITFFSDYIEEDGDRLERRYTKLIINEDLLITNYIFKDCDFENETYKSISESNVVFEYNTITDNDVITYLTYAQNASFTTGV